MSTQQILSNPVVRFKEYYEQFSDRPMSQLESLYARDVHFVDPIHDIHSFEKLNSHFESMCTGLLECRFEFLSETITDDDAWFQWCMHFRHPKLKNGSPLQVVGASHIRWNSETSDQPGKVNYHEDFYDMGAMLYEHIPLLGRVVKALKNRL